MRNKKNTENVRQRPVNLNNGEAYEDWLVSHWRPMVAYAYIAIILFDFIIGPIMVTAFAALMKTELIMWQSLTLDQAGTFHLAMGAILGLAAWSRGQEKVERVRTGKDTRRTLPKQTDMDEDFEVEDPFKKDS